MTVDEAFDLFSKIKLLATNTGVNEEIAKAHNEMLLELETWEQQSDPITDEKNFHALEKKKEWWHNKSVKWIDGQPMLKEIKL